MVRCGLTLFFEPLQHGDPVEVLACRGFATDGLEGSGDGDFFAQVQKFQIEERAGKVGRGGEDSGLHYAAASSGFDEMKIFMEADVLFDSEAFIEIEEIDTATQKNVLAIIDGFSAGIVRCCAATEEWAGFEKTHVVACSAESGRRGQSGQATADDEDGHRPTRLKSRVKSGWERGPGVLHRRCRQLSRRRAKSRTQ